MGDNIHTITLRREDGFRFRASFDSVPAAPALVFDEPAPLGSDTGPNAADVLGAAVANCLSASLLMCLQKSRASVEGLTTEARVRIERNDKGRLRIAGIDVTIAPALGPEDQAKLDRCSGMFKDFCTVSASLEAGFPVTVTVTPESGRA
jgi:organic hydroperoxide reductase OsmC/OhrA